MIHIIHISKLSTTQNIFFFPNQSSLFIFSSPTLTFSSSFSLALLIISSAVSADVSKASLVSLHSVRLYPPTRLVSWWSASSALYTPEFTTSFILLKRASALFWVWIHRIRVSSVTTGKQNHIIFFEISSSERTQETGTVTRNILFTNAVLAKVGPETCIRPFQISSQPGVLVVVSLIKRIYEIERFEKINKHTFH